MKKKITITPFRVADLLAEDERMPVWLAHTDEPWRPEMRDSGLSVSLWTGKTL